MKKNPNLTLAILLFFHSQVTEEKFTSLCYAGHLPGYTMGYNHHGMVATINTMSAKHLRAGKTRK